VAVNVGDSRAHWEGAGPPGAPDVPSAFADRCPDTHGHRTCLESIRPQPSDSDREAARLSLSPSP